MAKDFSRAFYHSPAWRRARAAAMRRSHGLCEECLKRGVVRPAEIVHHIVELTPANVSDPTVATDLSNLECVCRECHARVHGYTTPCVRDGLAFDGQGNLVCIGTD